MLWWRPVVVMLSIFRPIASQAHGAQRRAGEHAERAGKERKKARQSLRTGISEVAIVLHRALLSLREVLVLYLDKLHHVGFGCKVVDAVVVGVGVGAVGLDVDVACLARFGRWLRRGRLLNWAVAPEEALGVLTLEEDSGYEAVGW